MDSGVPLPKEQRRGPDKTPEKELEIVHQVSEMPAPAILSLIQADNANTTNHLHSRGIFFTQCKDVHFESCLSSGLGSAHDSWVRLIIGIRHHEDRFPTVRRATH